MTTTRFSLFASLPAELRNQIWEAALPDKVSQALYFYKPGCWGPRRLTESDANYDPGNNAPNLVMQFFHDLLDCVGVEVELPLLFVNHEARSIALHWIAEQGLQVLFSRDFRRPFALTFVCSFDPVHDTLYVSHDRWTYFLYEANDRLFESDLFGQIVWYHPGPGLKSVAVPEELLADDGFPTLPDMFVWYPNLETFCIVVSAPSDLRHEDGVEVQPRWELQDTQDAAFIWRKESDRFEWKGTGRYMGKNKHLCDQIEDAGDWLHESLAKNQKRRFEIRPVFAIKK